VLHPDPSRRHRIICLVRRGRLEEAEEALWLWEGQESQPLGREPGYGHAAETVEGTLQHH
jgi:hypothetical protein